MNAADHPLVDVIADHHAGMLDDETEATVARHVNGCGECRGLLRRIDSVAELLADEGTRPVPMPAPVAARLEQAVADESGHRKNQVSSLGDRRTPQPSSRRVARRGWPLLAAAAAVVVASAVGFQVAGDESLLQDGGSGGLSQSGGVVGQSQEDVEAGRAEGDRPGSAPRDPSSQVPTLRRDRQGELVRLGRSVATGRVRPVPVGKTCATPASYADGDVSLVRWNGDDAVVAVDPQARRVVVLDCDTASQRLFSVGY